MKRHCFVKILSVMLTISMLLVMLSGCAGKQSGRSDGKISIVATIFPQYDFARRIAGDRADIKMLLRPGMEAHSYEPSPKDIIGISKCDLFLNVGGESESWLETVLESADNPHMRIVSAIDCVEPIEEETAEEEVDEAQAEESGRPQPPEGFDPANMPEGFDPANMPEGFDPENPPEGFDPANMPEGFPSAEEGVTDDAQD